MENRPPRILILGRRGAGKSSLINAIFAERVATVGSVLSETGAAVWHTLENTKGALRILDTRGLGDLSKPQSASFAESIEEIRQGIEAVCPDAILFMCKAKEVDAHIAKDIDSVITLRKFIAETHHYAIPVAALVTQVDELDPKRVEPPYANSQKQANIHQAVDALQNAFAGFHIELLKVIPVSAYAEYENGQRVYDNYWNIDLLIDYLMEVLPNSAQLQLARLSSLKKTQRKFARRLVGSTATICAGIAATPIPLADVIPITAAQIGMIIGIAYISGREMTRQSAIEFLTALGVNVGAGFALREGARALIKFVFVGAGEVISAGVAFAGTWGIGEAAIAYFVEGVSIDEAKIRFKKAKADNKL
ncbi:MAG: 50S ribosome-binding GTPase [Caldilineaceae bacterium]|nr:50S ribosome-binding GTPase [Caldilineaceae bacterium]MBP8108397.1 50S ribosome-binding GTPase [Caldilineaceae bacterium]MBP8125033.1 50S ribosome-binding GTPase [Caldilineaceae bacterium]MBP9072460.1 50S ribosome-binding GTPase [Caldilineaceae bacterium]